MLSYDNDWEWDSKLSAWSPARSSASSPKLVPGVLMGIGGVHNDVPRFVVLVRWYLDGM
jgi:hypothetical protein